MNGIWKEAFDSMLSEISLIEKSHPLGVGTLSDYFEFFEKNSRFVLWGASRGGKDTKQFLESLGKEVIAFIDSDTNKYGRIYEGIKVYSPTQIKQILSKDVKLVLSTIYYDQLTDFLKELNLLPLLDWTISPLILELKKASWENLITQPTLVTFSTKVAGKNFLELVRENEDAIRQLLDLFSDKESAITYLSILRSRILYFLGEKPKKSSYLQYVHPEFIWDSEVIVDGGAFTGDTIETFISNRIPFKRVFAFEVDDENYRVLAKKFSSNSRIVVFNKALWSEEKELLVEINDYHSSSRVHTKGNSSIYKKVTATTIDSLSREYKEKLTFIKLDIEGSELETLRGARETIVSNKPKLAISIYHKPEDLWNIPQMVYSLNKSYKFFCGHHSNKLFESILYAI